MEEGRHRQYVPQDEDAEERNEFRKPRDSILNIAAEFYSTCHRRLKDLRRTLGDPNFKSPELLDPKSHNVS